MKDKELRKLIGGRAKQRRLELNLTQPYVAEKMGVTASTILRYDQQRLYPFFFRSVTAVFPFCSISKTVNQFQSDAIYQAEKASRGS